MMSVEISEPVAPEQPVATPPSLVRKAVSFLSAEAQWLTRGRPLRSVHDINHLYYRVCRPCEFFVNDGCTVCGCRIVPNERGGFNKLAMATTNCPLPEPKWVSEITPPDGMAKDAYEAALKNSRAVLMEITPSVEPALDSHAELVKKKEGADAVPANPFFRTTTGQIVQEDGT
jgi:hypothetical protein